MPEPDKNLTASQEPDAAAVYLAGIAALEQAATPGPWWTDENERVWRLHGVAGIIPAWPADGGGILVPDQVINKQIAKAPKQGTPYAEYWPDAADEAFIVAARSAVPRLLGAVEKIRALHGGHVNEDYPDETPVCPECGEWCPCPTELAITAELLREVPSDGS